MRLRGSDTTGYGPIRDANSGSRRMRGHPAAPAVHRSRRHARHRRAPVAHLRPAPPSYGGSAAGSGGGAPPGKGGTGVTGRGGSVGPTGTAGTTGKGGTTGTAGTTGRAGTTGQAGNTDARHHRAPLAPRDWRRAACRVNTDCKARSAALPASASLCPRDTPFANSTANAAPGPLPSRRLPTGLHEQRRLRHRRRLHGGILPARPEWRRPLCAQRRLRQRRLHQWLLPRRLRLDATAARSTAA